MLEDPDGTGESTAVVDTHSLLLSLAGLIDDELLGWSRELVAVGESDYALELVTAAVVADRVRLPASAHAMLRAAADRRGLLGRADTPLPGPDTAPRMPHRFLADPSVGGFPARAEELSPERALRALPGRLLRGCRLWLSWRSTPAGAAPGPLPHPVVLVETADGSGADVLAYQIADLLWQAGVFASVEVLSVGAELSGYHGAALDEARAIGVGPDRRSRDGAPGIGGDPAPTPPHGTSAPPDGAPRTPLHPVDRVITARTSTTVRGPARPDPAAGEPEDPATSFDGRSVGSPPAGGREGPWPPPRARFGPSHSGTDKFPAAERPGPVGDGPGPSGPVPPGAPPHRPRPRPAEFPELRPDPAEIPELPPGLSDVEQRLLRQLHEELAAREDEGPSLPEADQPPSRIFRNANGGRKPGPPRSTGPPPPDRSG